MGGTITVVFILEIKYLLVRSQPELLSQPLRFSKKKKKKNEDKGVKITNESPFSFIYVILSHCIWTWNDYDVLHVQASPVVIRSGLYTIHMNYLLNETGESFIDFRSWWVVIVYHNDFPKEIQFLGVIFSPAHLCGVLIFVGPAFWEPNLPGPTFQGI